MSLISHKEGALQKLEKEWRRDLDLGATWFCLLRLASSAGFWFRLSDHGGSGFCRSFVGRVESVKKLEGQDLDLELALLKRWQE